MGIFSTALNGCAFFFFFCLQCGPPTMSQGAALFSRGGGGESSFVRLYFAQGAPP